MHITILMHSFNMSVICLVYCNNILKPLCGIDLSIIDHYLKYEMVYVEHAVVVIKLFSSFIILHAYSSICLGNIKSSRRN